MSAIMDPAGAIALGLWLISDLAFWGASIARDTPHGWNSSSRTAGWAEATFLYLPLMLLLGPLLWVAFVYFRSRG